MQKKLIALFLVVLVGCLPSKNQTADISDFIPKNSSLVLKINDFESFKSDLKNNDFMEKFANHSYYQTIATSLDQINNIQAKSELLLCLNTKNDSLNYTIITKYSDSLFGSQSNDSLNLFTRVVESIFIGSNRKIEIGINGMASNNGIHYLNNSSQIKNKSFTAYMNSSNSISLINLFVEDSVHSQSVNSYLNTQFLADKINLNGIIESTDTLAQIEMAFAKNIPQENKIQQIAPTDAQGFLSITYHDFSTLSKNLIRETSQKNDTLFASSLFESLSEIGEIYFENNKAIVLTSIDVISTKDALLNYQEIESSFKNENIFLFDNENIFSQTFYPYISQDDVSKYVVLDDFFVFSNSTEILQHIITSYKNNSTLINDYALSENMTYLSDESSVLFVANSKLLKNRLFKFLNVDFSNISIDEYNFSAFQMVQDDGFTHVNGIISKTKNRTSINKITEEFNVSINADILMTPHFVKNHRTKQKEIVVQDINNVLYLISNSGKILWQKQLNGNILGRVQQVDLFKNGRLQLAFATPKRVYVIDRNGNDVHPFPLKFNDDITQPLSVFDYDSNKKYRLMVVQDDTILIYGSNGKNVTGFNYRNTGNISSQPKHFRVNGKDYIVFVAGNRMQILSRRGQIRIPNNTSFDHSGSDVFFYKNSFTTTSSNGELIQIDLNGSLSNQQLNLDPDHAIDATSKTLTTLSENRLSIRQNNLELDFGDYTNPKIFYLYDKIYVSITDRQAQKIHLYDSQGRPINNFPVYGNSTIDLDNIDNDQKLEFVTVGESNSIILYKKN